MEPKPINQKLITAAAVASVAIQVAMGIILAIYWN